MIRGIHFLIIFVALLIAFSITQRPASAACIPGIPCVQAYTPNTPSTPSDGPNATGSPNANKSDSAACDADFMNQIYARAFLEANREVMIEELLVTKPDSVLEYTCFDQTVGETAKYAGPIFSESTRWHTSSISTPDGSLTIDTYMGPNSLSGRLEDLVIKSLSEFTNKSFAHDFLGGTATGSNYNISTTIPSSSSPCTNMNNVFFLAKCENINPATHFMRFIDMATNDPRNTLPPTLQCGSINPITTNLIDVAENKNGTYAFKDNIISYLNFMISSACEPPIPTGLKVTQDYYCVDPTTGNVTKNAAMSHTYNDYVCPNPGCYFQYNSTSCQTTAPTTSPPSPCP